MRNSNVELVVVCHKINIAMSQLLLLLRYDLISSLMLLIVQTVVNEGEETGAAARETVHRLLGGFDVDLGYLGDSN
jgi:hypothetical protein